MFLKRELEGYLEINGGAGITPEEAAKGPPGTMPIRPGQRIQLATLKCSHCPKQVVLRPERERERGSCFQCDHYICDECAIAYKISGICRNWKRRADEFLNAIAKGTSANV